MSLHYLQLGFLLGIPKVVGLARRVLSFKDFVSSSRSILLIQFDDQWRLYLLCSCLKSHIIYDDKNVAL